MTQETLDAALMRAQRSHERLGYRGAGCDGCRGTGYRGRTAIYELLQVTEEIRGHILRRASAGEIRRHAMEKRELTTLREDGWAKAAAGVTTVEELLRVTQEDG